MIYTCNIYLYKGRYMISMKARQIITIIVQENVSPTRIMLKSMGQNFQMFQKLNQWDLPFY